MPYPLGLSDEDVCRIVNDIDVVPLAMSLVQLSGDDAILGEIEPHISGPWDHMEKIPVSLRNRLRERMVVVLKACGQGVAPKPAEPSPQQMLRRPALLLHLRAATEPPVIIKP